MVWTARRQAAADHRCHHRRSRSRSRWPGSPRSRAPRSCSPGSAGCRWSSGSPSGCPQPAPVIELDVTDPEHLAALADRVREHVDGLDGVLHSIGVRAGSPRSAAASSTRRGTDVATAVHVSTYSLQVAGDGRAAADAGRGGSIVGLTFDATVRPGRSTTGWAWRRPGWSRPTRYLARDLGPEGASGSTWSRPARCGRWRPSRSRASSSSRTLGRRGRRSAGTSPTRSRPPGPACALLSDWFPATTGEIVHVDGGFHAIGV